MNWIRFVVVSASLSLATTVLAKTAGCPCSPCHCGVCTCGGGGGSKSPPKSGGKSKGGDSGKTVSKGGEGGHAHHDGHGHHNGHGHGGVGVGVNVNVDLSGIGRRTSEPDPFAAGGSAPQQPVAHTQEKRIPKTKEPETPRSNAFDEIRLTGQDAKGDYTIPVGDKTDELEPPTVWKDGGNHPTTIDDLKGAKNAYREAWFKYVNGNPKFKKASDEFTQTGNTSKLNKIEDGFKQTDVGKKLFDNWMKAYQDLAKSGADVPDELVPSDKLEIAKHHLTTAEKEVKSAQDTYNSHKDYAVTNHNGVKNIQKAVDELNKKTHFSDKDAQADRDKLKQLQADLDNAKKQAAKEWAESDQAKDDAKNIKVAEQHLDKAKADFTPYEGLEHNAPKAAANP